MTVGADPAALRKAARATKDVAGDVVSARSAIAALNDYVPQGLKTDVQIEALTSWGDNLNTLSTTLVDFGNRVNTTADNFEKAGDGHLPDNAFAPDTRKH